VIAVGLTDGIVLVALAVMTAALVVDRMLAAAPQPAAAPGAGSALVAPRPAPALPVPDLAELSARTEGWAVLGPAGTVVATNLPERAALLAGACAVLRLASGSDGALPWRTVTLEGPSGILLGEASPRGAVLAVLARRDADGDELRRAMALALGEIDRRWAALPPGG